MYKIYYPCLLILFLGSGLFGQKQDSLPYEEMFITYEVGAKYPGGQDSFWVFITKHLKWPSPELCNEGIEVVGFDISKKGKVENIKIIRSIGELYDKEVLRVMELMPDWIPATFLGRPIVSQIYLPIRFKLE